jgi:hypothetical protein
VLKGPLVGAYLQQGQLAAKWSATRKVLVRRVGPCNKGRGLDCARVGDRGLEASGEMVLCELEVSSRNLGGRKQSSEVRGACAEAGWSRVRPTSCEGMLFTGEGWVPFGEKFAE